MYRSSSVKNLMSLGISEEIAQKIRAVWSAANDGEIVWAVGAELAAEAIKEFRSYYTKPGLIIYKRWIIDRLFETCGVEYLGRHNRNHSEVYYCNAGDTYVGTIIFMGTTLTIGCLGDLVEKNLIAGAHQ